MNSSDWLLQIFEVSDKSAQHRITDMLLDAPRVAVHCASRDSQDYVFIDAQDEHCGHLAYELVMCADPDAHLVHTSEGPATSGTPHLARVVRLPLRSYEDLVG